MYQKALGINLIVCILITPIMYLSDKLFQALEFSTFLLIQIHNQFRKLAITYGRWSLHFIFMPFSQQQPATFIPKESSIHLSFPVYVGLLFILLPPILSFTTSTEGSLEQPGLKISQTELALLDFTYTSFTWSQPKKAGQNGTSRPQTIFTAF